MSNSKKILVIFGTRPEVIKLAPVIQALRQPGCHLEPVICATGQHREMADMMIRVFDLVTDYRLDIMHANQTPFDITRRILEGLPPVLQKVQPDFVLVQGDTTTTFSAALTAFYAQIPIGHVEAGLRTYNRYQPFPEEMNRRLTSHLATLHFAPTPAARQQLLAEGIDEHSVYVTGNTVIDALLRVRERVANMDFPEFRQVNFSRKVILVTVHRREMFGRPLEQICRAFKEIVASFPEVEIVYPVHQNPHVKQVVLKLLGNVERIHLLAPLEYLAFVALMDRCYLILTDSGGIQEEAPSLNKPVLILRHTTERPEVLATGAAKLVGNDPELIVNQTVELLEHADLYHTMANAANPFGDGTAGAKIVDRLKEFLSQQNQFNLPRYQNGHQQANF